MWKRIFRVAFFIFTLWILVKMSLSTFDIWKKRDILAERQSELKNAESENNRLKRAIEDSQSQGFIEKEARDKLGLVKPGETVVLIVTPIATPGASENSISTTTITQDDESTNWSRWLKLFL